MHEQRSAGDQDRRLYHVDQVGRTPPGSEQCGGGGIQSRDTLGLWLCDHAGSGDRADVVGASSIGEICGPNGLEVVCCGKEADACRQS